MAATVAPKGLGPQDPTKKLADWVKLLGQPFTRKLVFKNFGPETPPPLNSGGCSRWLLGDAPQTPDFLFNHIEISTYPKRFSVHDITIYSNLKQSIHSNSEHPHSYALSRGRGFIFKNSKTRFRSVSLRAVLGPCVQFYRCKALEQKGPKHQNRYERSLTFYIIRFVSNDK